MDLTDYKLPQPQKKMSKYRWQDLCAEIIKLSEFDKRQSGIVWRLWTDGGYPLIEKVLAELKQGEVKNPEIYIKWLLKKQPL